MPGFSPGAHLAGGWTAAAVHRREADTFYVPIIPIVLELRRAGLSLRAIARELDRRGIRTRQVGKSEFLGCAPDGTMLWEHSVLRWNASQVRRVLRRAGWQEPPKVAAA